jgi:hypothetical protein
MAVIKKVLDPADYGRLAEAGGPLADVIPNPEHTVVNVVEEDGRVVAYWPTFNAVHAEPLWIAETHRHRREVTIALVEQVMETLQGCGVPVAFGIIADVDLIINLPMAKKLGFQKAPGELYFITVPPKEGGT